MTETAPVDADFFTHNHVDPYQGYEALRQGCPVYHDETTGAYFVSRYDDVVEVFRNPAKFSARAHRLNTLVSAARAGKLDELGEPRRVALVADDDPYHAFLRSLMARSFTPRAIKELTPTVEGIAAQLFENMPPDQVVDVLPVLCVPLPSRTIAAMYGLPEHDYLRFNEWTEGFLSPEPEVYDPAVEAFNDYFRTEIHDRKARPREDMVTRLAQATMADGTPLPEEEVLALLRQNILAGNETTTNLLASMLFLLAQDPQLWSEARQDRTLVSSIVEETLRFESPSQWIPRRARADVTIDGVAIPKDATVLPMMGSANRDGGRWTRPDKFDPKVEPAARHLAFGLGVHFCVGAPLARLEATVALDGLLDRFASVETAGEPTITDVFLGTRGYRSMPLRFNT
jgi:cytochrome P450